MFGKLLGNLSSIRKIVYSASYYSQTHYDVLKLPTSCSTKDIRDAFINLSKKHHPDKHLNDPSTHDRFVQINEAYSVLINPSSRRAYDITISHKKKIEPPISRGYQYTTRTEKYNTSDYSFYKKEKMRNKENNYYGVKGVKKVTTNRIVYYIIVFTTVGALIQLFILRITTRKNREKALAKTAELNLIHSMGREKAKLYGNKYQLEMLKQSLEKSFKIEDDEVLDSNKHADVCERCKKARQ